MKAFRHAARTGLILCAAFNIAAFSAPAEAHAQTHVHHTKPHRNAADYPGKPAKPTMMLQFYNVHTGESLTLTRHKGEALPANATWFMRDYRRGVTINMNPHLFDLLGKLQANIQKRHPTLPVVFNVVSSYRTETTNEHLRDAGGSQAKFSQHILGKAMDIRVPGISTAELRDLATCLKGGGVGFYAEDQFVHVDVGRVRYWPSHDYLSSVNCHTPKDTLVASRETRGPKRG